MRLIKLIKPKNFRKISLFLFLSLISILTASVVESKTVSAGYAQIDQFLPQVVQYGPIISTPESGQYVNLTLGQSDQDAGAGGLRNGYGANLPISFLRLYADPSDGNGARTILFDVVDRRAVPAQSCENYRIIYTVYYVYGDGTPTGDGYFDHKTINSCTGGIGIDIRANSLTKSTRIEDNGVLKANLSLAIQRDPNPPGATNNVTATLRLNSNAGNLRMGYLGGYPVTIYPSLTQAGDHEIEMRFRGPCGTNEQRTITWGDDDFGALSQLQSPNVVVEEYDRNGSYTGRNVVLGGPNYGGSSDGNVRIDMRTGHQYIIRFNWINGGNGIRLDYPYDSADFYLPCPNWDITALASSVTNPWVEIGTSTTFKHIINSTSVTGLPPNLTGRSANLNYNPVDDNAAPNPQATGPYWNANNVPGVIPLGSWDVTDNLNAVKSIPNNINHTGREFCQRYAINPKTVVDGVVTPPGIYIGPFACTKVVGGKTSAVAQNTTDPYKEGGELVTFAGSLNTDGFNAAGTTWPGYSVTCEYHLTLQKPGGSPNEIPGTRNSCNQNITSNADFDIDTGYTIAPDENIGSVICLTINISAANPALIGGASSTNGCYTVAAKPFVRAYQGDVVTGGHFGETGAVGSGKVDGYFRGTHAGSGSEFALIAAGSVGSISTSNGFASAFMRDLIAGTKPLPKDGLTFANNIGYDSTAGLGKYYDTASRTVEDFYVTTKEKKTIEREIQDLAGNTIDQNKINNPDTVIGETANNNGQSWYKPESGTMVTIDSASDLVINKSKKHTIYIDGDVLINRNITYQDLEDYANKDEIPYFSLIVKGNIYISSGVTRLDGRYIAQPRGVNNNDANSGIIYTCTKPNSGVRYAASELYNGCQNKLTVNGTVTAQKIKFLRTKGTLREIKYTPSSSSGGTAGINSGGWAWNTNASGNGSQNAAGCGSKKKVLINVSTDPNWNDANNYFCFQSVYDMTFIPGNILQSFADNNGLSAATITALLANCARFSNPQEAHSDWASSYLCAHPPAAAGQILSPVDVGLELKYNYEPCPAGKQSTEIHELVWNPANSEGGQDPWGYDSNTGLFKVHLCYLPDSGVVTVAEKWEQLLFNVAGADGAENAEEFRLTPEFLIGDPALKPKSNGDPLNGRYDSIVTMPPIL